MNSKTKELTDAQLDSFRSLGSFILIAKVVVVGVFDNIVVVWYNARRLKVMDKLAEEKVRKLTQNQAKVLKAVAFPSPDMSFGTAVPGSYVSAATGLTQNALGGTVSALQRNEIIMPLGRDGRQYNWELVDPDVLKARQEDPVSLSEILNKISGESK